MSDNNSQVSDTNIQKKVTDEFKNKVLKWLSIDDKIREYRQQIKTLIKEKNFISKKTMCKILRRMSNIEIDDNFDLLVARSLAKYKNLK